MIDPTVEFVEVELEGKTYQMAFDLESLCDAEDALMAVGIQANLLHCLELSNLTGNSVRTLFALSLRKAQPDLDFNEARKLVTHKNIQLVRSMILSAWCASVGVDDDDAEKKAMTAETVETQPLAVEAISAESSAG